MDTPKIQKLAAKLVHLGMHVTLGVLVITGLMIGLLFWLNLKDTFLVETVVATQEFAVPLMFWLIAIHVCATIYHRLLND